MILQPFTITSRGRTFRFVQRAALDSESLKKQITDMVVANHAYSQQEAMCSQLGLAEIGVIPNFRWGVFEDSALVGIFGLGCVQYVSGPWADTLDWEITDPTALAIFKARPMSGFLNFDPADEVALSVEVAVHLLGRNAPHRTAEGTHFGFSQLEWAVLLGHADPISLRAKRFNNAAKADARLRITEQTTGVLTKVVAVIA